MYIYVRVYKYAHINETTFVSCESHVWLFLWPHGLYPSRLLCPWDFPGRNTGVGCHFVLQGIFLTQGLNPCLLWLTHCRRILNHWATDIKDIDFFFLFYAASQSMSSPHKHSITGNLNNGMKHCEYQVLPSADRLLYWAAEPSCLALRLCMGFPGSWLAHPPVTRNWSYRFVSSSAQVCLYPAINSCGKKMLNGH